MPTILVSYRRDDSKWITGRIVDRLEQHFGKTNVFMDIDSIPVGMDFREHLRNVLDQCDVLLAVVGPQWLVADKAGRPRILDAVDWVRIEIETALTKKIPIIPVLIDEAGMPKPDELPAALQDFAFRQAAFLNTGRDFHAHMDRLIRAIGESATRQTNAKSGAQTVRMDAPAQTPEKIVIPARREVAKTAHPPPEPPSTLAAVLANARKPAPFKPVEPAADTASSSSGPQSQPPDHKTPSGARRLTVAVAAVLVLAGLGAWGYWELTTLIDGIKTTDVADGPAPPRATKIVDRINPNAPVTSQPPDKSVWGVAQRAVLYEEDPNDPQGKHYTGTAVWRTETVSPGPGIAPALAIRADVEIPERRITMTWSLRRNTDPSLPATHTVEMMFRLPPDYAPGSIASVPGVLMKESESTRGTPLAGLSVKVTDGFFLFGLSAVEAESKRNISQLKERAWFDIPVVYSNGRRGILALEKGTPGERVFAETFKVWQQ